MELERTLTDPQRDEFEDMLRALTLERSQIKEAMGFALDNADAAGEVMHDVAASSYVVFLNHLPLQMVLQRSWIWCLTQLLLRI